MRGRSFAPRATARARAHLCQPPVLAARPILARAAAAHLHQAPAAAFGWALHPQPAVALDWAGAAARLQTPASPAAASAQADWRHQAVQQAARPRHQR